VGGAVFQESGKRFKLFELEDLGLISGHSTSSALLVFLQLHWNLKTLFLCICKPCKKKKKVVKVKHWVGESFHS